MEIIISVKVSPNSRKQKIEKNAQGEVKFFLVKAPENGKANDELRALLSKRLSLPKSNIVILKGVTSKSKLLKIVGIKSLEKFYEKLGLDVQLAIK